MERLKYSDSPYGGMSNVPKAMSLVRERIIRLMKYDNDLNNSFDYYEKYYNFLLNKQINVIIIGSLSMKLK